jgi:hypothetical protein
MHEIQRRHVLRFHPESASGQEQDRSDRENLDRELGKLGRLELEAEASTGEAQQRATAEIDAVNREFEVLIHKSPAFAHYLDSYLYFKIRFAAGRFSNPALRPAATAAHSPANGSQPEWNERSVGLPPPPPCEGRDPAALSGEVERFLALENSANSKAALKFLDGFVEQREESRKFDLWLRGLLPRGEPDTRFETLAGGIYEWALQRCAFYVSLEEGIGNGPHELSRKRVWHARNPLAARCGGTDLYWLAKILRAEVSPRGIVSYVDRSWLYYLPASPLNFPKDELLRIEEVLRATFDYACELIQNAVEMAEYCEKRDAQPDDFPDPRPSHSDDWRGVQDDEIEEIAGQRNERKLSGVPPPPPLERARNRLSGAYWSRRIRTGEYEEDLVGVAISGGGIRSATFALGVLERLKELDYLRYADYLSTVSGGGYIGAWLLGNVRRTRYFLSRMTSWQESIQRLRDYSKYLAPQSGFLSADSWVIWGTWIRNATLIQLTAVAWLAAGFVLALAGKAGFEWIGSQPVSEAMHLLLAAGCLVLAGLITVNLRERKTGRSNQHHLIVAVAWIGSFLSAALLWSRTSVAEDYSVILKSEYSQWLYIGPSMLAAMWWISLVSFPAAKRFRAFWSVLIALFTGGVMYLASCGVRYLFGVWAGMRKDEFGWYAYVFGPPLVLLAVTFAVVVFIGILGRTSDDWRREWWTRYGSWLAMYGAGFLALALVAVFGHVWIAKLAHLPYKSIKWSAVVGWIGSVASGLLAGNSGKTGGSAEGSSRILEWVARIGGILFIIGAVLLLSTGLHFVLVQIWLDYGGLWWQDLNQLLTPATLVVTFFSLLILGGLFSWRFDLNTFGLNQFYRNRLVRCYLGATRWKPGSRQPERFTGFDDNDDLSLTELQFRFVNSKYEEERFRGPFPIVNCALNLGGSSDLSVKTRQSTSFTLTPLSAGAARARVGYAPMPEGGQNGFSGGVLLGEAISISGAAASPNMGHNTSPLVSVLLTLFNVRLAWWFPNPGEKWWSWRGSPLSIYYLLKEFLGLADEGSRYVNVSDGGHFENLAIYELIRRRVKVIIASDGECDPDLNFGSLGNLIRICETDFGAKIEIDVSSVRKQANGQSRAHCAVGRIAYSNGSLGYLIYLKSSLTGDEDPDIEQYHAEHPDFPHESTGNQFFTEDQFESYRRLGHHIASLAFRDADYGTNLVDIARGLYDVWTPAGFSSDAFVTHTALLDQIWERFRASTDLLPLLQELMADRSGPVREAPPSHEELAACLELGQLMENVFLDLRLDDFWNHPDNRGWVTLFTMWAKSPTFRSAWSQIHGTFGIRFDYFCQQHLGL